MGVEMFHTTVPWLRDCSQSVPSTWPLSLP